MVKFHTNQIIKRKSNQIKFLYENVLEPLQLNKFIIDILVYFKFSNIYLTLSNAPSLPLFPDTIVFSATFHFAVPSYWINLKTICEFSSTLPTNIEEKINQVVHLELYGTFPNRKS